MSELCWCPMGDKPHVRNSGGRSCWKEERRVTPSLTASGPADFYAAHAPKSDDPRKEAKT